MTPASEHLAHARAIRLEAPAQRQGAGCRNFSRLPARGGAFSLDILPEGQENFEVTNIWLRK